MSEAFDTQAKLKLRPPKKKREPKRKAGGVKPPLQRNDRAGQE